MKGNNYDFQFEAIERCTNPTIKKIREKIKALDSGFRMHGEQEVNGRWEHKDFTIKKIDEHRLCIRFPNCHSSDFHHVEGISYALLLDILRGFLLKKYEEILGFARVRGDEGFYVYFNSIEGAHVEREFEESPDPNFLIARQASCIYLNVNQDGYVAIKSANDGAFTV